MQSSECNPHISISHKIYRCILVHKIWCQIQSFGLAIIHEYFISIQLYFCRINTTMKTKKRKAELAYRVTNKTLASARNIMLWVMMSLLLLCVLDSLPWWHMPRDMMIIRWWFHFESRFRCDNRFISMSTSNGQRKLC